MSRYRDPMEYDFPGIIACPSNTKDPDEWDWDNWENWPEDDKKAFPLGESMINGKQAKRLSECDGLFIDRWHDTTEVLPDSLDVWFIADGKICVGVYEPEQRIFCMADGMGIELKDVRQWKYVGVEKQIALYPKEKQVVAAEVKGLPCLVTGIFSGHCMDEELYEEFKGLVVDEDYQFDCCDCCDTINWKNVFGWYRLPEEPIVIKDPIGDSALAVLPAKEEVVEIVPEETKEECCPECGKCPCECEIPEVVEQDGGQDKVTSAIVKANDEEDALKSGLSEAREHEMNFISIHTNRDGYAPYQCGSTMTIGQLVDWLGQFDEDYKVYFNNDGGYTYGSINEDDIEEEEYYEDFDESLKSSGRKLQEKAGKGLSQIRPGYYECFNDLIGKIGRNEALEQITMLIDRKELEDAIYEVAQWYGIFVNSDDFDDKYMKDGGDWLGESKKALKEGDNVRYKGRKYVIKSFKENGQVEIGNGSEDIIVEACDIKDYMHSRMNEAIGDGIIYPEKDENDFPEEGNPEEEFADPIENPDFVEDGMDADEYPLTADHEVAEDAPDSELDPEEFVKRMAGSGMDDSDIQGAVEVYVMDHPELDEDEILNDIRSLQSSDDRYGFLPESLSREVAEYLSLIKG